jgi:hypothetical protein
VHLRRAEHLRADLALPSCCPKFKLDGLVAHARWEAELTVDADERNVVGGAIHVDHVPGEVSQGKIDVFHARTAHPEDAVAMAALDGDRKRPVLALLESAPHETRHRDEASGELSGAESHPVGQGVGYR